MKFSMFLSGVKNVVFVPQGVQPLQLHTGSFCTTFQAIDLIWECPQSSPMQRIFNALYPKSSINPPSQKSSPFSEEESYYAPPLF